MANPPFNVDKVKSESTQAAGRLPFGMSGVNKNKEIGNANYLWISYFYSYLNDTGRAGFVMASSATDSQGKDKDILNEHLYYYNIGNVYFLQNQFEASESAYNEAISSNGLYAPAFLNRANTRIKLEKLEGALQDYKIYLNLNPETLQRSSIEKMISLLEGLAEEAERARALAEAKKAAEEAERLAAEARYKKLMEDVNANLSSVDNADAVSAGADDTIDYSEENELD